MGLQTNISKYAKWRCFKMSFIYHWCWRGWTIWTTSSGREGEKLKWLLSDWRRDSSLSQFLYDRQQVARKINHQKYNNCLSCLCEFTSLGFKVSGTLSCCSLYLWFYGKHNERIFVQVWHDWIKQSDLRWWFNWGKSYCVKPLTLETVVTLYLVHESWAWNTTSPPLIKGKMFTLFVSHRWPDHLFSVQCRSMWFIAQSFCLIEQFGIVFQFPHKGVYYI